MEPRESKSSRHFNISMAKSIVRVAAFTMLSLNHIGSAGIILIVAELFGIAEEL
jgi:hypothetical protein